MSKFQLEIWEDVEAAMANAVTHYKTSGKSLDFLSDLDDKLEIILSNPFTYQIRFRQVRSVRLRSFPFVLLYKVEQYKIQLLDLVHSSSDWERTD